MTEELKDKEIQEAQEKQDEEVVESSEEIKEDQAEDTTEESEENQEEKTAEEEQAEKEERKTFILNCLIVFAVPCLVLIAFLLTGILIPGAWRMNWLLFLIVPIYWSGLVAGYKRNPYLFLFPLLALGTYLFIGLAVADNKGWNPFWLILLEIPLYYLACWLVRSLMNQEEPEEFIEEDAPEVEAEPEPEPEPEPQPEPEPVVVPTPEPEHKEKRNISHRREKLAIKPKEKRTKVVVEDKNYDKNKSKVKLKADITQNPNHTEESVETTEE